MDEDMWHHATTQKNLKNLAQIGFQMMEAEYGELASGLTGMGRMPEPETIFQTLTAHFKEKDILSGKKALVTAGPTYENIDPVRFIGNYSSGKMGVAIAKRLAHLGAKVELVLGPVQLEVSHPNIRVTKVRSAEQMFDACIHVFPECQFAIMSAAVADYTPESVADEKIKKQEGSLQIQLKKTKDILKHLGTLKSPQQVLIGFALESKDEKAYAIRKLNEKNADAIVMNSIRTPGAGFAVDTNQVTIFEKEGVETAYELKPKEEVAHDIVDKMLTIYRQKLIE
jgi:phosphopantothenoylcysteine decarboxylase/phosphopantothenate--cysteine ligase